MLHFKFPSAQTIFDRLIQRGMTFQNVYLLYGAILPNSNPSHNRAASSCLSCERRIEDRRYVNGAEFGVSGE